MTEAQKEIGRFYATGPEEEGWGHKPRKSSVLKKLEKGSNDVLPLRASRKTEPCQHLDIRTSDLQKCKMIGICCFRPLNFGDFLQ